MALREYFVRIKVLNKRMDVDGIEYTVSKSLGINMKDIKVVKEIEYTDGGYNVKEI